MSVQFNILASQILLFSLTRTILRDEKKGIFSSSGGCGDVAVCVRRKKGDEEQEGRGGRIKTDKHVYL